MNVAYSAFTDTLLKMMINCFPFLGRSYGYKIHRKYVWLLILCIDKKWMCEWRGELTRTLWSCVLLKCLRWNHEPNGNSFAQKCLIWNCVIWYIHSTMHVLTYSFIIMCSRVFSSFGLRFTVQWNRGWAQSTISIIILSKFESGGSRATRYRATKYVHRIQSRKI